MTSKFWIGVFIAGMAGIFLLLAFLSSDDKIERLREIKEELKKPNPVAEESVPLPADIGQGEDFKNLSPEMTFRQRVIAVVRGGGGGLQGEYQQFSQTCLQQGGGVLLDANSSSLIMECYIISEDSGKLAGQMQIAVLIIAIYKQALTREAAA